MRGYRFLALILTLALTSPALAQEAKRLVLITQSKGFDHDVVKRNDGKPSLVETTFEALATKTKLFKVEAMRDSSILTPQKLKNTDIVVLYTTGVLPMKPEDLDAWVKEGGLLLGIHPATDTYHNTEVYQKLIGGEFIDHPWHAKDTVTIKVLDPIHAAAKSWVGAGEGLTFKEEIYQHKNFDPAQVHVILGLDMEKTELKKPFFVPIAWCKQHGKGKVFYTSLGHRDDVWTNPRYQDHLVSAILWLTGQASGDAKPNPEISAKEEEIARKVAPKEEPKNPDEKKKVEAEPGPPLPHLPDGFHVEVFAKAPDIKSPASIAAAPDGRLFVGEDEYNTQPKRDPGLARVKLCMDSDGDGRADKFTVFADKLNSPQGLTFVGGTLYVVHAPLLTAFRDMNNDGVADVRDDLVTGLGPAPEGLVHHVPSGLRMGIDGWLYISIGDKGIVAAKGKDGRKVSLWGGGVVRVRPDGTMMELYSSHTRNTFDVSVDPYLNLFTRDNTNDGDGWDSRLTQMQRDGEYGYPSLFKHWPDEIIDPIGSYGGGSATGTMYVHEPGWPGTYGDSLYTCDWARGILYRHDLKRKGASFEPTAEAFLKDIRPADVDVDAIGNMYMSDWGRRDWGVTGAVGYVFRIDAQRDAPLPAMRDMKAASEVELLNELASASQIRRIEAQWELLHRKTSQGFATTLMNMAMRSDFELDARVAALFTLAQLEGENAHSALATLASLPEMREYALRAMADRDDRLFGVKSDLFAAGLKDANPRVRVQAAIGIGHVGNPALAAALVPLTADVDPLVRHAAMQSLRRLKALDVCIAALKDSSKPDVIKGAMRTLRSMHDPAVVGAVAEFLQKDPAPAMRQEAIRALATLYHVEAKWDGTWWTPRPDTRGPYYVHEAWAQSPRVASLLIAAIDDRDPATAKVALEYIGLVEMKEATTTLSRMIAGGGGLRDDTAKALIAIKASTTEALSALERVVLGDNFGNDARTAAAAALAGVPAAKSQPVLVRILLRLDYVAKPPAGLVEKVADALASRPIIPAQATALLGLMSANKPAVRLAAATALMRSKDATVQQQTARVWQSADPTRLEALLSAVPALPKEASEPYREQIHNLLRDTRPVIRQKSTIALGHIGDASAVKDLVALAHRDRDPLPAVSALAGIDPARTADDQVLIVATLLVENSSKMSKAADRAAYARVLDAAQKFLNDPRVPAPKAGALRSKLMEPGVIYQYMATDAIPVGQADKTFDAKFPPELTPASAGGVPFSVNGKEVKWKPLLVSQPDGMHELGMRENSVMYLSATYDMKDAGSGYLTCGSDDGLQAWVNGKKVINKDLDRGLKADDDKEVVSLVAGKNTLLFKVNNRGTASGIQARVRSRVPEFQPDELARAAKRSHIDIDRGRKLFIETLGCIKCHTINREDEPKGPFLGDAGGKFDAKYLTESIVKPSAKIAQGFASERILSKGAPPTGAADGDYVGFITKETAEEVQIRDASGKVTVVPKSSITKRTPQPGSIMPDGLTDNLGLDDFGSLLGFLESMK